MMNLLTNGIRKGPVMQRAFGFGAAFLGTVIVATPAIGDDTELLLTQPPGITGKPNILFILDTSGSMNTKEQTIAFYDNALTYSGGGCDNNSFYWSDTGTVPSCDVSNINLIDKSALVCASAALSMGSVGNYKGVLAQYHNGSGGGSKWQVLKGGLNSAIVECAKDSGTHGSGTIGEVYAQSGTDNPPFSSDSGLEVDWTSSATNSDYILYAGNYLNWRAVPIDEAITRFNIVKTILRKVLTVYDDVNIGLMRFNGVDGGPVLHAIKDLKTDRVAFDTLIAGLEASGNTPLSETFYEGALYWRGMEAHFAETVAEHTTDPAAFASTTPKVYAAPAFGGSCPRNFNILLTDGAPSQDADTVDLVSNLPNFPTVPGICTPSVTTNNTDGICLDDIAEYLFTEDISPQAGVQTVSTYGVGFLASQDDFRLTQETTEKSGGKFFLATDPETLATSLLAIFDEITEQSLSFAAPSVAVNAFNRTQNLNDIYMTVFKSKAQTHWPGNVKKYRLVNGAITDAAGQPAVDPTTGFFADTATSFWSSGVDGADVELVGAANELPDPAVRKLYTYNGSDVDLSGSSNAVSTTNAAAYTLADFGLTGADGEPDIDTIIDWARGVDVKDEDQDTATTVRNAMGDPLHSQPAAVNYGTGGVADVIVYAATNDGYLHALDADTGAEIWSFIPKQFLSGLHRLYQDPLSRSKQYAIDGDIVPVVNDVNKNGEIETADGDFIYLIFGMRRGGNNYIALDVTDKNSPEVLWNVTYPQFGQSWSKPVVTRINTTTNGINSDQGVVVIGAGYDTVHDSAIQPATADSEGAGIFMLDLEDGDVIWRAGPDSSADLTLTTMTRAFPTEIKVIDLNGDGYANRMYAADVGGQIWRFDVFSDAAPGVGAGGSPALVTGGIIAQFGLDGTSERRTYNAPDVSIFNDVHQQRRYIAVSIGSGYRAHPLNSNATDRFYSLRDPDVFTSLTQQSYNGYNIATDADMIEVSGTTQLVLTASDRGWRFTLPANQMILADSATFDGKVFFVGFSPETNILTACETTVGNNFLYQVSVVNGDPIADLSVLNPLNSDNARVTTLEQGGIAPSPRFLFPSPDDPNCTGPACSPPPIGCVGVECFDPGFANHPVRTLWTQDGIE